VNLHSNLDYADLNITYPNGLPGGHGLPAGLPATTNELRVLVVPLRLNGGGEVPAYATNGWFQRLMFSETNGPDARNIANSARKYFEQNTYGRVRLSGDIYPEWVTAGMARHYTTGEVSQIPQRLVHEAVQAIRANTPSFFENRHYDFIVALMPGDFAAIYNSYYEQSSLYWDDPDHNFGGYLVMDLPVEQTSRLLSPITNEVNTVVGGRYVQPAFRALKVVGVWLAGDTNHTGTNFFTGGSVDFSGNEITLGTAPPPGSSVLVDYTVGTFYQQQAAIPDFFSYGQAGVWYGAFLHEFAHGLGPHVTFTGTEYIGDLYLGADLIDYYGLMSGGNHNYENTDWPLWNDPACMDAYMKFALGFVHAYELRLGENELNLRLWAAEEFPYTARAKLIKVPLHPDGYIARRRLRGFDYAGEEYLLIELRKKRAVPGIHNFDVGLPHEGVVIYHVTESENYIIGAFYKNYVRVMDATPELAPGTIYFDPEPLNNVRSSLFGTPAPFGFDAGRFEYVHGAQWQSVGNSNLPFRLEGPGPVTLYAKFGDGTTNESAVTSAPVTFNPWPDANTNGIDDRWEMKYFGSLNSPRGAASADPDDDAFSNLAEFTAGTDPTNRASRLTLSGRFTGTNYAVRVPTGLGTSYNLEFSRDLGRPRWIFTGTFTGDGTALEWVDWQRSSGVRRFYRVVVPEH
jgi:hypothetical protein